MKPLIVHAQAEAETSHEAHYYAVAPQKRPPFYWRTRLA